MESSITVLYPTFGVPRRYLALIYRIQFKSDFNRHGGRSVFSSYRLCLPALPEIGGLSVAGLRLFSQPRGNPRTRYCRAGTSGSRLLTRPGGSVLFTHGTKKSDVGDRRIHTIRQDYEQGDDTE